MKPKYVILVILLALVLAYGTGSIACKYQGAVKTAGNTFTAFSSAIWTQTSRADFEASQLESNIDTSAVPGDILLEKRTNGNYRASGNLRSQVFDTGINNARIDMLLWNSAEPRNTDITFRIRARNTYFAPDSSSPAWTSLSGNSPVTSGLPTGRYVQWRVYLTTDDTDVTPALHDVQIWYH